MSKEALVDMVIEQIRQDIEEGDVSALDELLHLVPEQFLLGFLHEPEELLPKQETA